jgi:putative transposase
VAPNILARRFRPERPNSSWAADVTYVRTLQGWLYLAVVLDLYSRRIVGWATSARIDRELALKALAMGIGRRGPVPGLIHHSGRGSQYTSWDYQRAMQKLGVVCSMSRKGNCFDNAVAESLFSTLKTELVHRTCFVDRSQAHSSLFDYIETFYNPVRRHSALGYLSPMGFERRFSREQRAA